MFSLHTLIIYYFYYRKEFVNPGISIPSKITELTKITNDDVKDANKFGQVASDLKDWINNKTMGYDEVIFVGHYSSYYDAPLIETEMLRHGCAFLLRDLFHGIVDTCSLVKDERVWEKHSKGKPGKFNQNSVYQHLFGYAQKDLHNAAGDIKGNLEITNEIDPDLEHGRQHHYYPLSYDDVDQTSLSADKKKLANESIRKYRPSNSSLLEYLI